MRRNLVTFLVLSSSKTSFLTWKAAASLAIESEHSKPLVTVITFPQGQNCKVTNISALRHQMIPVVCKIHKRDKVSSTVQETVHKQGHKDSNRKETVHK